MFASQCLFCGHANPAGAKFCNDCASPLHLKPCEQCDAINDKPATICYKCGAELPGQLSATAASSAPPAADAALASSASGDGDIDSGHTPLLQRATEALNVLPRPSGSELAGARTHDVEVVAREPRRLTPSVTPFFSMEQRTGHVIPVRHFVAIAQRSRIARGALPPLLVGALALSGYYIYRNAQLDVGGSSSAIRTLSSAVPAKTGAPATVSLGTVGLSTEATSRPGPVVAPESDVAGSQVAQGQIRTTGSESVHPETPTPAQAPPAAASQSVDTVGVGPRPAAPVANESRQKAMQAAGQRVVPKQMASNRSRATYPEPVEGLLMRPRAVDTGMRVAPNASRARVCTEVVAVLGLCNSDTRGESK
jgi:hypothetical protein